MDLPAFPYHPEPVANGVIVESDVACVVCGQRRGAIYTGPVYSEEELNETLCPWCIADGTATARFGAEFLDVQNAGDDVPREVLDALVQRTPGFHAWQDPQWMFHCGDGAVFLGAVPRARLGEHPGAVESLDLDVEDASALLFRCRHCATHLAYIDLD